MLTEAALTVNLMLTRVLFIGFAWAFSRRSGPAQRAGGTQGPTPSCGRIWKHRVKNAGHVKKSFKRWTKLREYSELVTVCPLSKEKVKKGSTSRKNWCWGSVTFWCGSGSLPLPNGSDSFLYPQAHHLPSSKYNFLQKFGGKILFCKHCSTSSWEKGRIRSRILDLWLMDPQPEQDPDPQHRKKQYQKFEIFKKLKGS